MKIEFFNSKVYRKWVNSQKNTFFDISPLQIRKKPCRNFRFKRGYPRGFFCRIFGVRDFRSTEFPKFSQKLSFCWILFFHVLPAWNKFLHNFLTTFPIVIVGKSVFQEKTRFYVSGHEKLKNVMFFRYFLQSAP